MAPAAKQAPEPTMKDIYDLATGLKSEIDGIKTKMAKIPAPGMPTPAAVFGLPNVRKGENVMTSRGWSLQKMFGVLTGAIKPEYASVEIGLAEKLDKCFNNDTLARAGAGYQYTKFGQPGKSTFLAPLASGFMAEDMVTAEDRYEMKSLMRASCQGYDPDEQAWIAKRMMEVPGYRQKAMSWLSEVTGGALVAPPEMGELIELLRNKEALVNAGARVVPLPAQGRMVYPRQTSPSLTFWVGESSPITDTTPGTGEVTLQAKKLAVLIKAPNELIRFASPTTEALIRDDMTKSLALGLDLAGLEGSGTDTRPRGLLNYPNINRIVSSVSNPSGTGDKLVGGDIYRMIAAVEESNAEYESWVMRPKTLYKYYQLRADSVAQNDNAGPFLFNLIREAGDGVKATIAGYPVVKSTQVSQVRSNSSYGPNAVNLTYVAGGMWSDMLIGMFGAIEFAATTLGDTAFVQDQTWVRGILSADIQLRHEAAFVIMDNLNLNI